MSEVNYYNTDGHRAVCFPSLWAAIPVIAQYTCYLE